MGQGYGGRPTTCVTSVMLSGPRMCNVVWAKDVVGRPTTGVTSVTLCGPRIWWKANYICKKCNVVWTQDMEERPTTGCLKFCKV